MSQELANYQASPFDAIRQVDDNGREYWSARDLQELLGYADWRNFEDSIEKAMISCEISGQDPSQHWVGGVTKPIISGKGRKQKVKDYHMTRYACYTTALNGDVRKKQIADAQRYFVAKAREAEVAQRPLTETEIFNQNFHQRCVKNASRVPAGYWLIAVEMGKEAWSERAYHVELQYNRLPDGSAGKKWPNHLRKIGYDIDKRVKVWCELPNGEGHVWAYPEEYLLEFRRWMRNEYKDHFINRYAPPRLLKPIIKQLA
jgi:hypothetical protein